MKNILVIIGSCISVFLLSQKKGTDTLVLQEVIIQSKELSTYSVGHQTSTLRTDSIHQHIRLNTLLENKLGISFKNYGLGNLSSISTKGLSASHTGFYWEDIPLNSSLNGQSDVNLFPIEQSREITFRSGGGSSVFGSGAIGGSIHFSNPIEFEKEQLEISQGIGSFFTFNSNLKGIYSTKKIYVDASLYNLTSSNNFKYKTQNNTYKKIENSDIQQNQFSLNSAYKINKNNLVKFNYQKLISKRELPSSINSAQSFSKQKDENQRASLKYSTEFSRIKITSQLAYNDENYSYIADKRKNVESKSNAKNYFLGISANRYFSKSFQLQLKNLVQHTQASGESFGEQKISQNFTALSAFYKPSAKLETSATINKSYSSEYRIPFTFDAGINYNINKTHALNTNFTTNYRVPTINDLYWTPGGNKNLQSEKGWLGEIGYELTKETELSKNNTFRINVFTQMHYGKISDWILWQPNGSGLWSPINIQNVTISGLQNSIDLQLKLKNISFRYSNIYHLTKSINEKNNYQLSYIPRHTMNQNFGITFKNLSVNYVINFVGKRFVVSDESKSLNSYVLQNLDVSYNFEIGKNKCSISALANNLFSEEYYGIENYPLPLRNYYINLNIIL